MNDPFHYVKGRGYEVRARSRFMEPARPLLLCIALLLIVDGLLALSDPQLVDRSSNKYLAFMGPHWLALTYLLAGALAIASSFLDDWRWAIPQEAVLLVLTAGVVDLAAQGRISVDGHPVHLSWQRVLAAGLSVILLTAFHTLSLFLMATSRRQVYVIAEDQFNGLARALARAETAKITLRGVSEINDSILQDVIAARGLLEAGGFDRQAADHLDRALARTQDLITKLLTDAGVEKLAPGEVVSGEPGLAPSP